jgi:Plasmid pRiA4b ORF-3-like protein
MADQTIPEIYLLHVWIRQISPMIGRRLLVRSDSTLAALHDTIQIAFGWTDSHLHRFRIHGRDRGVSSIGFCSENPGRDSATGAINPLTPMRNSGVTPVRGGANFRDAEACMRAQASARRSDQRRQNSGGGPRRTSRWESFCSACSPGFRGRQDRVRGDVRARLLGELGASVNQRPPTRHPPPASWTTRTRPHFHHTGCRISGISDCWRIRPGRPKQRIRLSSLPQPSHIPAERPPAGIRQQYRECGRAQLPGKLTPKATAKKKQATSPGTKER